MQEKQSTHVITVPVLLLVKAGVARLQHDARIWWVCNAVSFDVMAGDLKIICQVGIDAGVHNLAIDEIQARRLNVDHVVMETEVAAYVREGMVSWRLPVLQERRFGI